MEGTNCGGDGGWTRVAFVNMTKPGAIPALKVWIKQCLMDLRTVVGSRAVQLVVYLQLLIISSAFKRCVAEFLDISKMLQMLSDHNSKFNANISGVYFDGLAIMSGNPRRHIWTYTAGFRSSGTGSDSCPCNNGNTLSVPPFVGNDYYCESVTLSNSCDGPIVTNDVL